MQVPSRPGLCVGICMHEYAYVFVCWVPANTGNTTDTGSIPGSGRSLGEGNGNSLQYSCLENSMDRGAWWAKVYGVTKNQTRLCD